MWRKARPLHQALSAKLFSHHVWKSYQLTTISWRIGLRKLKRYLFKNINTKKYWLQRFNSSKQRLRVCKTSSSKIIQLMMQVHWKETSLNSKTTQSSHKQLSLKWETLIWQTKVCFRDSGSTGKGFIGRWVRGIDWYLILNPLFIQSFIFQYTSPYSWIFSKLN